jgi:hypothetical protein
MSEKFAPDTAKALADEIMEVVVKNNADPTDVLEACIMVASFTLGAVEGQKRRDALHRLVTAKMKYEMKRAAKMIGDHEQPEHRH